MASIFSNRKLMLTVMCLVLLYFTWGAVYLSIKFALESFPPIFLSGLRYVLAGSAFLIWTFIFKKDYSLPTLREFKIMTPVAFFMIVVSGAFLNISEVHISSGVAAIILGSTPLWLVISGWLFNNESKPNMMVVIGMLGGFFGVALLAVSTGLGGSNYILGVFCVFVSMAGWVIGSIFAKGHKLSISMIKSLGFQMLMGGVFMVTVAYFMGELDTFEFSNVSLKSYLALTHLVLFGAIIGYTCYVWLLFNTPTNIAASYAYAEPVLAVILGNIFAGESIDKFTIIACSLIIISIFFVMKGKLD